MLVSVSGSSRRALKGTFSLGSDSWFFPRSHHAIDTVVLQTLGASSHAVVVAKQMDGQVAFCNASNGRKLATIDLGKPCVEFGCAPHGEDSLLLVTADTDAHIDVWLVNVRDQHLRRRTSEVRLVTRISIESRILGLWLSRDSTLILNTSDGLASLRLNMRVLLAKY